MRVICEAGYSGCDHPKAFTWQGREFSVERIIKEWREPDSKHFMVSAANGSHFELTFTETGHMWIISEVSVSSTY